MFIGSIVVTTTIISGPALYKFGKAVGKVAISVGKRKISDYMTNRNFEKYVDLILRVSKF